MKIKSIKVLPRLGFVTTKGTGKPKLKKFKKVKGGRCNPERNFLFRIKDDKEIGCPVAKPLTGGLWTSPMIGDSWTVWLSGEAVHDRIFTPSCIYEIIPDDDCRVLVIDSLEDYLEFESKYMFSFKEMRDDFDILYVTQKGVDEASFGFGFKKSDKAIFRCGLDGWDVETALFLNKKFTVGDKLKIKKSKKENNRKGGKK